MKKLFLFILFCAIGLNAQYKNYIFEDESSILKLQIQQSSPTAQSYIMAGMAGTKSIVSWGDGTVELISWTGSDQTISHTPTVSTWCWVQFNNPQNIIKFKYTTEQKLYFDLSWFAVCPNLTYLYQETGITTSLTGNINSLLNLKKLTVLVLFGANTTTGLISQFQYLTSLGNLQFSGSNILNGVLDGYFLNNCITILIKGSTSISGNLSYLSSIANTIDIGGNNIISDYTSPKSWSNTINYFRFVPKSPGGLDTIEIDNLIIDLDDSAWGGSSKTLILTGTNAPPTAAADDALTSLALKGVSVTTN